MDGVLADFDSSADRISPGIFRVPYEKRKKDIDNIMKRKGFFENLEPIDGAIEAYGILCDTFNTYILSSAPWCAPHAWTEKRIWVEKHLGNLAKKRLILSNNKSLLIGDVLIDDTIYNGAAQFRGELIQFGTIEFPNWDYVLEHLLQ